MEPVRVRAADGSALKLPEPWPVWPELHRAAKWPVQWLMVAWAAACASALWLTPGWGGLVIVAALIGGLGGYVRLQEQYQRRLARAVAAGDFAPVSDWTVDGNGFETVAYGIVTTVPWSAVIEVAEDESGVFFVCGPTLAFGLPKAALDAAMLTEVRRLATEASGRFRMRS